MKPVARGKRAAASSSHRTVTRTMLDVMRAGGNAADAVIAGAMISATVEPHMTNDGGCVTCLYWDAKTARAYALNSTGTVVPGVPPFRVYRRGSVASRRRAGARWPKSSRGSCPASQRFTENSGTRPWAELARPLPTPPWRVTWFTGSSTRQPNRQAVDHLPARRA